MRLLFAEDERSLSRAIVTILEKNNYSVDAVYDGRTALEYIEGVGYDGVILDVMMPELDGISVLKAMRERGITTPVLMLTAKSEVDDKVLGLDSGANDYLTKPFEVKELLARLRAMTRTASNITTSRIVIGNVTLDLATFELSAPKGGFRLANKEFQMMEMLMRNKGQIISADKMLEHIWGFDSEAEANVVWVYVSYLRKKLTAIGANVSICAARNVGYFLEEQK